MDTYNNEQIVTPNSDTDGVNVDQKVEKLRNEILKNKIEMTRLVNNLFSTQEIAEYKNKKERNRKRNKMQKLSRKKNR